MKRLLLAAAISLVWLGAVVRAAEPARELPASALSTPTDASRPVDARGFIHRWLVLEPIVVPGQLTEIAVDTAIKGAQLPGAFSKLPLDGMVVDHNGPLRWHAVDTEDYNLNLYHFAWTLSKPTSNVLFWIVTTVDAPVEMRDVRLAIGSNAASRWWLNGDSVISIYSDRQTVIDDGVSKRLTLKKGRNVIRAAIINGGGATDFCARFLDSNDQPIAGLISTLTP